MTLSLSNTYALYFPLAAPPPPQKALSSAETPAFWSCLTQESIKETMFVCGFINSILYIFFTLFAN
jgi:hypothetical protein